MSSGLIGSLINPGMMARGDISHRDDTAFVARQQPEPSMSRMENRAPELPRDVNRAGPRDEQALSQYAAFSDQPLAGAGVGFSAVV